MSMQFQKITFISRKGDGTKPEHTTYNNPSIEYDSNTKIGRIWVKDVYRIQFNVTHFNVNNCAIHIKGTIENSSANGSIECFVRM